MQLVRPDTVRNRKELSGNHAASDKPAVENFVIYQVLGETD
jgi:hypothetical protein